jgi:hypothetical protein
MGSEVAEGRGKPITFAYDRLRINQTRQPLDGGSVMTQHRTPWIIRNLCKAAGQGYMDSLVDQLCLVHMAGARGFQDNVEWKVPLASDADFGAICVNTVRAPTRNRHFLADGEGLKMVSATANEINLSTTDMMSTGVVDAIRTVMDSIPLPPAPVIFEGDKMASDSPLRVLMVSAEQYEAFLKSPSSNFRQLQANAMARANQAGQNPLFMGDAGLWNGILIIKMPKPIRFYADDPINWCGSYTSLTETTTDLVPAAFGTGYAIDRAILLGGQALAYALGKNPKTGNPFFWSEKLLDHDDKLEVLVGMISGMSKIRFEIDYGAAGKQFTDMGATVIDTAVKLSIPNG